MTERVRSRSIGVTAALVLGACLPAAAQGVDRTTDGIGVALGDKRLELRVCRRDVVRVLYAPPGPFFARQSIVTVPDACEATPFEVQAGPDAVAISTPRLTARVALPGGGVSFFASQRA